MLSFLLQVSRVDFTKLEGSIRIPTPRGSSGSPGVIRRPLISSPRLGLLSRYTALGTMVLFSTDATLLQAESEGHKGRDVVWVGEDSRPESLHQAGQLPRDYRHNFLSLGDDGAT